MIERVADTWLPFLSALATAMLLCPTLLGIKASI